MARITVRSWVTTSLAVGLLTSCFVPKYGEFESDAGSPGNSNSGGIAAVGGKSNAGGLTAIGGTTNSGGTSGTVGGTSSTTPGGTSATGGAGGSINVGGTSTTGGAGASSVGGASGGSSNSSTGGANGGGGANGVGGTLPSGGTGNTGGKVSVGGITSTGGVSSSPVGGTSASTGGTTAPTGGTAAVTGGATSSGGANPAGGSSTTGGVTGTGGTTSAPVPIQISAGFEHACALLSDNTVWCWGRNLWGELGISTTTSKSPVPVKVQFAGTGASVKAVAAGTYHSCAVFSDGTAQCWGDNEFGQLGNGTATSTSVPVVVKASASAALLGIQSISTGGKFTCSVVLESNKNIAKCWGYGSSGQLGTGCSSCNASYPSTVVTDTTNNTPLSGVSSVSAGSSHACAVLTGGATYCWGYNAYGQLGNGSTTDSNLPQLVYDGTNAMTATDVSAGGFATCALVNPSVTSVRCWGRNDYGQIGNKSNSTPQAQAVSVALTNDSTNPVIRISAGYRDACAVLKSGDIYCWGDGASGQLGQDPSASSLIADCINGGGNHCSSTPILVNSLDILKPNVKVSCGNQFMMAWNDSGSAYGLGLDYAYGQLGDGNTTSTNYTPVPLSASWLK